jgi:hypothetical protein
VREFSRYDAGWSYIGSPLPWDPLDDRAAIPNRLSTYLLAGLPVITDARPGFYRYDELARLGVNLDLGGSGYDDLGSRLEQENRTRERSDSAVRGRAGHSFDASIDALLGVLECARERYFSKSPDERSRFIESGRPLVHFTTSPDPGPARKLRGGASLTTVATAALMAAVSSDASGVAASQARGPGSRGFLQRTSQVPGGVRSQESQESRN